MTSEQFIELRFFNFFTRIILLVFLGCSTPTLLFASNQSVIDSTKTPTTNSELDDQSLILKARNIPIVTRFDGEPFRYEVTLTDPSVVEMEILSENLCYDRIGVEYPNGMVRPILRDDGENGDRVANDGIFTLSGIKPIQNGSTNVANWETQYLAEDWHRDREQRTIFRHQNGSEKELSVHIDVSCGAINLEVAIPDIYELGPDIRASDHVISIRMPSEQITYPYYKPLESKSRFPIDVILEKAREHVTGQIDWLLFQDFSGNSQSYLPVSRPYEGVYENPFVSEAGSWELLGIIRDQASWRSDTERLGLYGGDYSVLVHELNHTWSSFLPKELGISNNSGHYDYMESEKSCFNYSSFVGTYPDIEWDQNAKLAKLNLSNRSLACNELELYLMGLIPPEQVKPIMTLINAGEFRVEDGELVVNADEFRQVTIEDIIASVGERMPSHLSSKKDFKMMMIAAHDRLLTDDEMALFDYHMQDMALARPKHGMSFQEATSDLATLETKINLKQRPPPAANLSGSWYNPDRNGEGFHLEMLDNGGVMVIWFTYPGKSSGNKAKQAWILGTGTYEAGVITINNTFKGHGPVFGIDFDRDALELPPWGEMKITFNDAETGLVEFDGIDGVGSTQITRLSKVIQDSQSGGLPAGISGSWYNPETNGQGLFIEMISSTLALVYWFTYDENGNQAWNTGVGDVVGHSIIIRESLAGKGTVFGAGFNTEDIAMEPFAGMTLNFEDCNSGHFAYFPVNGTQPEVMPIKRVSNLAGRSCSALPSVEQGHMTMMSNPSDPVLRRYTGPDGAVYDLLGASDAQGNILNVSSAHIQLSGNRNMRFRFDGENKKYKMTDSGTGVELLLSRSEDGYATLTVTEPETNLSATINLDATVTSQEQQVQISAKTSRYSTDSTNHGIDENSGKRTVSVVVNDCNQTSTGQADVDFIIGDPSPTSSGKIMLVDSTKSKSESGEWVYHGTIPSELPPVSTPVLDTLCTSTSRNVTDFCAMVDFAELQAMGYCAGLTYAAATTGVLLPSIGVIAAGCAGLVATAEGLCTANDFRELLCDSTYATEDRGLFKQITAHVWADAHLGTQGKYSEAETLLPQQMEFRLDDIDFFGFPTVLDWSSVPGRVSAGSSYDLEVQVNCMSPGESLTIKRPSASFEDTCDLDENNKCQFSDIQTEPFWKWDQLLVTGPRGLNAPYNQPLHALQEFKGKMFVEGSLAVTHQSYPECGPVSDRFEFKDITVTKSGTYYVAEMNGKAIRKAPPLASCQILNHERPLQELYYLQQSGTGFQERMELIDGYILVQGTPLGGGYFGLKFKRLIDGGGLKGTIDGKTILGPK